MSNSSMSNSSETSPLDPVVRFVAMGFGLGCIGSFVPKFLHFVLDGINMNATWLINYNNLIAVVLIVIGFIAGGIIGLRLDPNKGTT